MKLASFYLYPIKGCAAVETLGLELLEKGPLHDRTHLFMNDQGRFLSQRDFPEMAKIKPQITGVGDTLALAISYEDRPVHFIPVLNQTTLKRDPTCVETTVKIHKDDPCPGIVLDKRFSDWFTPIFGAPVRIVQQMDHLARIRQSTTMGKEIRVSYADGYPLLVISKASIKYLNGRLTDAGYSEVDESRFRANIVLDDCDAHDEDRLEVVQMDHAEFSASIRAVKACSRCQVIDIDQVTGRRQSGRPVYNTLKEYRCGGKNVYFGMNYVVEKPGSIYKSSVITLP